MVMATRSGTPAAKGEAAPLDRSTPFYEDDLPGLVDYEERGVPRSLTECVSPVEFRPCESGVPMMVVRIQGNTGCKCFRAKGRKVGGLNVCYTQRGRA